MKKSCGRFNGRSLMIREKQKKFKIQIFELGMYHNQNYVSNVKIFPDAMMIAVPITRNGQVTRAIWGYYSISRI